MGGNVGIIYVFLRLLTFLFAFAVCFEIGFGFFFRKTLEKFFLPCFQGGYERL